MKWSEPDIDMVNAVLGHDGYRLILERAAEMERADRQKLEDARTPFEQTQFIRGRLSAFKAFHRDTIDTVIRDCRGGTDA